MSLVKTTTLPVGNAACPFGGAQIQSGIDTNANGVLDTAEVTATTNDCNYTGPVCPGCAALTVPFTATSQSATIMGEYTPTFEINQGGTSVITANLMVLGDTSGNIQLAVQQFSGGNYGGCYSGFTPMSTLYSHSGTVTVTFSLGSCALTALSVIEVVAKSGASYATPLPATLVLVDSLSISNVFNTGSTTVSPAPLTFSTAASVSPSQYSTTGAWLNTGANAPRGIDTDLVQLLIDRVQ